MGYRRSIIHTPAIVYPSRLSIIVPVQNDLSFPLQVKLVEDRKLHLSSIGDSIRTKFLDFYAARVHKVLPSASLVPEDPTVLLTIALPSSLFSLGSLPREAPPTAASQRWIRINDVENEDMEIHSWYFHDRLWISVYDDDDETYAIWHDMGIPASAYRIKRLGEDDNL
ncbi:hypothetical protein OROHE_019155 [Orobanche hederae]